MRKNHRSVFINDDQDIIYFSFKLKRLLKTAVTAVLDYEQHEGLYEISVTITDDDSIRQINKEYRGIDSATDVLSFPMDDEIILGDIIISVEKAISQAKEYGHSLEREIAFLCIHGMLHLLGYDHEISKEEELEMFGRQEKILNLLRLYR